MTREEAIMMLKSKMDGSVDTSYEWAETVRMAIEALQFAEHFDLLKEFQSLQEVVRCKDCMNYSVEGKTTQFGWCNALEMPTDEQRFCSYGEKREEDKI